MLSFAQLLLTLASATTAPQDAPQVSSPASETHQAQLIARVEELMQAAILEEGAVGLSLGVSLGGKLLYSAGYGKAELEHDVGTNKDTLFRIGSITKQFTGAAICRLAEEKKLFIDDPLGRFVPEFDTQGEEITIRQLLTHTSGIFNYTNLGPSWAQRMSLDLSHAELLKLVAHKPLDFRPGSAWNYSNTGYFLLGMIVEAASGMSYAEYLEQEFQKPLGLAHTRYGSSLDLIPNRAQGYAYLGHGKFANDDLISMTQPFAAGSMLANGEDLVRWSMALAAGKAVSPASFEEMTLPYILENGNESPYGFGLSLRDVNGQRCYSHSGGISGFNSMMFYFPESQLCVAVLSNSEGYGAEQLAARLVLRLQE